MIRRFAAPAFLVLLASASLPLPEATGGEREAVADIDDPIIIHHLRAGESLRLIADRWFADPAMLAQAQALNRISDPDHVRPGLAVRLRTSWLTSRPVAAQISSWRGGVQVVRAGDNETADREMSPARTGLMLEEGAVIETGREGFVTLRLGDGSQIALPSNSRIRIARLRQLLLTEAIDRHFALEQGRGEAQVAPVSGNGARFLISTPVSVAAVRGTRYRMAFTPDSARATTEVLEGRVEVSRAADGRGGVLLTPGLGVVADGANVGQPVSLLPAPRFDRIGTAESGGSIDVRVRPLAGGSHYRFALSADREGMEVLAAVESRDTRASFTGIAAGDYYVHVIGVGADGLWGQAGSIAVAHRPMAAAPSPPHGGGPFTGPVHATIYAPRNHPDAPDSLADILFAEDARRLAGPAGGIATVVAALDAADSAAQGMAAPQIAQLAGQPMPALLSARGGQPAYGSGGAGGFGGSGAPRPAPVLPASEDEDGGVQHVTPPDSGLLPGNPGGTFPPRPAPGNGLGPIDHFAPTPGHIVPEPATWLLLIGGFGAVGMALRWRRAAKAGSVA